MNPAPKLHSTKFTEALDHSLVRQHFIKQDGTLHPIAFLYTTDTDTQGILMKFENIQDPELLAGLFNHACQEHQAKWADLYIEGLSNKGPDEPHIQFALEAGLIKSHAELPSTHPTLTRTQFTPDHTIMQLYTINEDGTVDHNNPNHQVVLQDPTTHPMGMMPFHLM